MPSIEHRPDRPKPWRARQWGPDGRLHSRSFARKGDTQRWLAQVEASKLDGTWTNPALGRTRFADWLAEWQATTTNLRPSTEIRDLTYLRLYVRPRFDRFQLAKLTQREVRAWVADLSRQGLAPATVVKAYQLLGKVMAAAVDARMIPESPCRRVPLPKIERHEMRFLTPAEVDRLADIIRPDYRALVLLGAYGGLRIGEMAGLRRRRVDLDAGTVEIAEIITEPGGRLHIGPPKTRASRRRVGLPCFVMDALAQRMATPGRPEDHVFTGAYGAPLRVAGFRARIWPAVRTAGLDRLRIHDLRHTAVALWIAAGAGPKEVAARAGHTSVSFTLDRYGHLYPEADLGLRDRLEALRAGRMPQVFPRDATSAAPDPGRAL